jgi:hypothetical protein
LTDTLTTRTPAGWAAGTRTHADWASTLRPGNLPASTRPNAGWPASTWTHADLTARTMRPASTRTKPGGPDSTWTHADLTARTMCPASTRTKPGGPASTQFHADLAAAARPQAAIAQPGLALGVMTRTGLAWTTVSRTSLMAALTADAPGVALPTRMLSSDYRSGPVLVGPLNLWRLNRAAVPARRIGRGGRA